MSEDKASLSNHQSFMQDIQTHLLKSHWLGKLSKLKSGEIWETVQSGDDPPPPKRNDRLHFFETD